MASSPASAVTTHSRSFSGGITNGRPMLHVVPPTGPGSLGLAVGQPQAVTRRVWVKRPGMNATTVAVRDGDIVDDLKSWILQKYPTTLAQSCDPADLVIKVVGQVVTARGGANDARKRGGPSGGGGTGGSSAGASSTMIASNTSGSAGAAAAARSAYGAGSASWPASASIDSVTPASSGTDSSGWYGSGANSTVLSPATNKAQQQHHGGPGVNLNLPPPPPAPLFSSSSGVATASPRLGSPPLEVELQPDEVVFNVLDTYFPGGMKMQDALIVTEAHMGYLHYEAHQNPPHSASLSDTQMQHSVVPSASPQLEKSIDDNSANYSGGGSNGVVSSSKTIYPRPMRSNAPRQIIVPPSSNSLGAHTGFDPLSPVPPPSSTKAKSPSANAAANSMPPHSTPTPSTVTATPPIRGVAAPPDARSSNGVLLLPRQFKLPQGRNGSSAAGSKMAPNESSQHADPDSRNGSLESEHGGSTTIDQSITIHEQPRKSTAVVDGSSINNSANGTSPRKPPLTVPSSDMGVRRAASMRGKIPSLDNVVPQVNVLIVEDNVINQKILEAFMKRKKIRSAVAKNGKEAVDKWRQGGFHLVLMDIQLPVMSGLEATKEIRRLEHLNRVGAFSQKNSTPPAPEDTLDPKLFKSPVIIVALTASSLSADKSEALAAGCNDFLTKPVNLKWLEKKTIEWGCMQALIDFEGWKQWLPREDRSRASRSLLKLAGNSSSGRSRSRSSTGSRRQRSRPRSRSSSHAQNKLQRLTSTEHSPTVSTAH